MNYIVGENRNQIQMIALEQLVAPDSWARVIDLFVDILPIDELGFSCYHFSLFPKNKGRTDSLIAPISYDVI